MKKPEIEIVGVKTPEEKELIFLKINEALKGPLRILKKPEYITIYYKKHEKEGRRHLYELEFKLKSEYGITNVKSLEWDLVIAIETGLNELEKVIRKEKSKATDHSKI